MDYSDRYDAVVLAAWETWTENGLGLGADDREQTLKSVRDAATNEYYADISDVAWLQSTLARLGHKSTDA